MSSGSSAAIGWSTSRPAARVASLASAGNTGIFSSNAAALGALCAESRSAAFSGFASRQAL